MDGTGVALTRGRDKILLGRRPYHKELFDLDVDAGERHNRLESGGEADFARIAAVLAETYNGHTRHALGRRPASLDERLRGELAALGYASPGPAGDPRRIPRRIAPADRVPGGLLGLEGAGSLESCVDLAGSRGEHHLLRGWHAPETGGRWSKETGVLILGPPAGARRASLVLEGASYRPDTPRVTVRIDGRTLVESTMPPGAFRVSAPLDHFPEGRPVVVEISTDPGFVPSAQGAADSRTLGLFLFSACLRPADGSGAAARASTAP
jgi:hypothetical protein